MGLIIGFSQLLFAAVLILLVTLSTVLAYGLFLPGAYLLAMLEAMLWAPAATAGLADAGTGETAPEAAGDAGDEPVLLPPSAEPAGRGAGDHPALRLPARLDPVLIGEHAPGGDSGTRATPPSPPAGGRIRGGLRFPQVKVPAPPSRPGPRRVIWPGHPPDGDVAIPSYFYGPVLDDMGYVLRLSIREAAMILRRGQLIAQDTYDHFGIIRRVGIMLGAGPGVALGAVAMAAVAIAHLTVSALLALVATGVGALIRGADTSWRRIGRVSMTCPAHTRVIAPYPIYLCPRCGSRHRDIRPGPHGIMRRICKCQARLPTSLLLSRGTLAAECPECSARLPGKFGKIPEIIIPFAGANNAGKTQLMYRLYQTLCELIPAFGGTVSLEGDSQQRLDEIGRDMEISDSPQKTPADLPKAYVLHLTLGSEERQIYFFDAAGELHYQQASLKELGYLGKARCMVFVADPLAADSVWRGLPDARQRELAPLRSRMPECRRAYDLTREEMRRLKSKRKFARLAFVFSKADLVAEAAVHPGTSSPDLQRWAADPGGLDMGSMVRESVQSFADVGFFQTAAVIDNDGVPDRSVEVLAEWLLRSEDIKLRRGYGDP